ncbi:MAG: anti-sigma factor [Cyanobacteria bacterium P01_A01_bin.123]
MKDTNMPQPLSEAEKLLAAGYVIGDLTPEEAEQLAQLAATNVQFLEEVQALQASFDLIPQALSTVEPPMALREKITATPIQPITNRAAQPRLTGSIFKLLAGLIAIAALLLALDNLRLRNQLRIAQQANEDYVAGILQQPNSRLIALTGSSTDAAGTLLFTPGRWQEVIVSLGNLPPLPPDQIYRMWLVLENGEIIYCGEFNTDNDGSVFVRFTPLETPPQGVKATQLSVTIDVKAMPPDPATAGEQVMEGVI